MAAVVPKQGGPYAEKALPAKIALGFKNILRDSVVEEHGWEKVTDYVFWKRGWERHAFDENSQHDGCWVLLTFCLHYSALMSSLFPV